MKQHITAVGILHIGLGLLCLVAGVIVLVALVGAGFLALPAEGGREAFPILLTVGIVVGVLLLVLSLPGIIGGWGVLKLKPWARYLVLILSILDLFNIPIGTAIGIYTLWALLQPEAERLFAAPAA